MNFWRIVLFLMALYAVILKALGVDLKKLPLTKRLAQMGFEKRVDFFHKIGFVFCLGYLFFEIFGLLIQKNGSYHILFSRN